MHAGSPNGRYKMGGDIPLKICMPIPLITGDTQREANSFKNMHADSPHHGRYRSDSYPSPCASVHGSSERSGVVCTPVVMLNLFQRIIIHISLYKFDQT